MPAIGDELKKKIDRWIAESGRNEFGDPAGTAYAGGTPLFNEFTGRQLDRYEYILKRHPELRDR